MDQVGYAVEKFTYIFKRVPTTFAEFMILNDFLMNIVSQRRTTYPDLYITYITEVVGIYFGILWANQWFALEIHRWVYDLPLSQFELNRNKPKLFTDFEHQNTNSECMLSTIRTGHRLGDDRMF